MRRVAPQNTANDGDVEAHGSKPIKDKVRGSVMALGLDKILLVALCIIMVVVIKQERRISELEDHVLSAHAAIQGSTVASGNNAAMSSVGGVVSVDKPFVNGDEIGASPGLPYPEFLKQKSPPNVVPPAVEPQNEVRRIYGGKGDPKHLGGFTKNDTDGQSPSLWTWMTTELNVRSFLDVGCGRGISTKWFMDHGTDVLCVEGSSDALEKSLLPLEKVVQHDFLKGPWWPAEEKTYDVVWAVEFLEHIQRKFMHNYIATFKRAALVFVTFSTWGGWHHVEVDPEWWWRLKMKQHGFEFSPMLTEMARQGSQYSRKDGFNAQHLWLHLMVFINPEVAQLPRHLHLFKGGGCYYPDETLPKDFKPEIGQGVVECPPGPDEPPAKFKASTQRGDSKYIPQIKKMQEKIGGKYEKSVSVL